MMSANGMLDPEALAAFQAKYNAEFARETFSSSAPGPDGTLVLRPDREGVDPLPPVGCFVKVHGYGGQTWRAVVVSVDERAGTYTVRIE